MKKTVSVFMSVMVVMFLFCGINVYAVEPRYTYTTLATCTLNIVSDTAYCKASVVGNSSVTSISGTMYLEKKNGRNWDIVDSWTDSSSNNSLHMNFSLSGLSSGRYRARAVFTVYSGNSSEPVEATSFEKII